MGTIDVNYSGFCGTNGKDGEDFEKDVGSLKAGENGLPGSNGQHAGDITLEMHTDLQSGNVHLSYKAAEEKNVEIPFTDLPQISVALRARGGNGGAGGSGGKGARGESGKAGWNAQSYSGGGNGTPGGKGGNGGNGAAGGNGGNGGNITVKIHSTDIDLLPMIKADVSGGRAGEGGEKGKGGSGGSGGLGGKPFSWTETRTESHTEYVAGRQYIRVQTRTIPHHSPGGINGTFGTWGQDGEKGSDGVNGYYGKYVIFLTDKNISYSGMYDLVIEGFTLTTSDDSLVLPGKTIGFENIALRNKGLMISPANNVQLELKKDDVIYASTSPVVIPEILPGQAVNLNSVMSFSIDPRSLIQTEEKVVYREAEIGLELKSTRLNKILAVSKNKTIKISYPVQMSSISNPEIMLVGDEAPISVLIRNISDKPLEQEVKISLSLEDAHAKDILWKSKKGNQTRLMDKPLEKTICFPPGKKELVFSGTLQFVGSDIPFNATLHINVKLEVFIPELNKNIVIQKKSSHMTLSQAYFFDPTADFILIIHQGTLLEEINYWKKIAEFFQTKLSILNISVYEFYYIPAWKDKIVIILNNEFVDSSNRKCILDQYVNFQKIYEAAKKNNISTYIVNGPTSLPNVSFLTKIPGVLVEKRFLRNNRTVIFSRASEIEKEMSLKYPDRNFIVTYYCREKNIFADYYGLSPREKGEWIGKIFIREELCSTHKKIASACLIHEREDIRYFSLFKILPFEKKLQYLDSKYNKKHKNIQVFSIISDLVDEQLAFGNNRSLIEFSEESLKVMLPHFSILNNFDLKEIININEKRELFCEFLVTLEFLLKNISDYTRCNVIKIYKEYVDNSLKKMNVSINEKNKILNLVIETYRDKKLFREKNEISRFVFKIPVKENISEEEKKWEIVKFYQAPFFLTDNNTNFNGSRWFGQDFRVIEVTDFEQPEVGILENKFSEDKVTYYLHSPSTIYRDSIKRADLIKSQNSKNRDKAIEESEKKCKFESPIPIKKSQPSNR